MLIEQQKLIAKMPVKEGFGYEQPTLPPSIAASVSGGAGGSSPAGPSRSKGGARSGRGGSAAVDDALGGDSAGAGAKGKAKRRKTPEFTDSEDEDSYSSMDEDAVKDLLRPVKKSLRKLKNGTDNLSREEKISALKECLSAIGSQIDKALVEKEAEGADVNKWRKHCWV